jgi:hypothetical protein
MRTATALLNLVLLVAVAGLIGLPGSDAMAAQPDDATEDILYLVNGDKLHGEIISEDRNFVEFKYTDDRVNIKMTRKFSHDEIEKIERDQPVDAKPAASETKKKPNRVKRATSRPDDGDDDGTYHGRSTIGVRRGAHDDESLPTFYIVPMKGQMGTDVNSEVYDEIIEDITATNPDYLVVEMDCRDSEDWLHRDIDLKETGLSSGEFLRDYQVLVRKFHVDLEHIPQVLWVKDADGVSAVVALSWDKIYIAPEGRMGGMAPMSAFVVMLDRDPNLRGKVEAYTMGWLRGMVEFGDVDLELVDAMVLPSKILSATWKGRDVDWTLNDLGEYVVDASTKRAAEFTAKMAEDFVLADGVAETMDDVALLMGVREYRIIDGEGDDIFEDYREGWRSAFERCKEWYREWQEIQALGGDPVQVLGQTKRRLEQILAAVEKYKAVELRVQMEWGMSRLWLIQQIEIIKEQLRAARGNRRNRGGGGRSGGGMGAGGG